MSVYENLKEHGIELPKQLAAAGLYKPVNQAGNLVFISGQGSMVDDTKITGRVGADLSVEEGAAAARICAINTLAALEAYLATFQLQGGYVAVPEKLDLSNPDYGPLAEMGFPYLSTLKLGYTLVSGGDPVLGIDAKTGEPVVYRYEQAAVQYGDLDTAPWAKSAVETLARYGVGYAGDSFAPTQALTQRDLVALLVSTRGYRVDPGALDDAGADDLYRTAYGMGLLTRAEREDGRPLTRLETAKLLLDAGGAAPGDLPHRLLRPGRHSRRTAGLRRPGPGAGHGSGGRLRPPESQPHRHPGRGRGHALCLHGASLLMQEKPRDSRMAVPRFGFHCSFSCARRCSSACTCSLSRCFTRKVDNTRATRVRDSICSWVQ